MNKTQRNPFFYSVLSISLALAACSPELSPSLLNKAISQPPIGRSSQALQKSESVSFVYTQYQGFKTQVVDTSALKYIRLTLIGEGIASPISNEGGFIPIKDGKAQISINGIPSHAGALRIVTVQGYDADLNPLPAFVGKGFYISASNQKEIQLTIDRKQLLTGLVLEQLLLSKPEALATLNLGTLQTLIAEALGFDQTTKRFGFDPTLFDAQKIVQAFIQNGIWPSVSDIQNTMKASLASIDIMVSVPGGVRFTEAVNIAINDPKSQAQLINVNKASPQNLSFQVAPGMWKVSAQKTDGTVLDQATIKVSSNGGIELERSGLEIKSLKADPSLQCIADVQESRKASLLRMEGLQNEINTLSVQANQQNGLIVDAQHKLDNQLYVKFCHAPADGAQEALRLLPQEALVHFQEHADLDYLGECTEPIVWDGDCLNPPPETLADEYARYSEQCLGGGEEEEEGY